MGCVPIIDFRVFAINLITINMKERISNSFFISNFYPVASAILLAFVPFGATKASLAVSSVVNSKESVQQQVHGKVTTATGPLSGVTVTIKGSSSLVTSTDANGGFSIAASRGDILVFTAVGYSSQEKIVGESQIHVVLESKESQLEEVVVVGYGTQRRESLTGALQTVSGQKLRNVTTPAVENMLNGKAAGVSVSPGSGKPGARGAVVIRGQATLNGTTSPLWVIDGVIVGSTAGDLNPDDIESMSILKDAASTAIYGSQGANGVIVVSTKNPRAQKMSVTLTTKMGYNSLNNGNLNMMSGAELYDYYASLPNASEIKFPRWNADLKNSNFDWWDLATQRGFTQNHNISLQGGSEQVQSYLSVGFYDEVGAVKGYNYDRYNVRMKTNYKPFSWLTIKPAIAGARRGVQDRQYSTLAMYQNFPWDSPYGKDGELLPHRDNSWVNNSSTNYLYDLQWNKSGNINYEFTGNLDFDIKLTDWLTFSSINNYRYNNYSVSGYIDPRSNAGLNVLGRITEYRSEISRRYTNQIIRFNKRFDKHDINALLAYEYNDNRTKMLDVYGTGFIPGFEVLSVVATPERTKGSITEWAVQSMLFNANYAYDGRYMAQFSFRRDGASNFGDNAKYGNFFSISAGWNIHRENWFKADYVDALKVRASYGSVGNRPSELYPQYSLYSVSSSYNGIPGALISQVGNKNLTWERTYTSGFGVDGAMFNNRLRFAVDYYTKKTDNILYRVPITGTTGVTSVLQNIGEMKNDGLELAIGGDLIRNDKLSWSLDFNIGHNRNTLTKLYPIKDASGNFVVRPIIVSDGSNLAGSAERVLEPGSPIDTYYLKEWAGVNSENGAPMWYVVQRDEQGNELNRETTSDYSKATLEKTGRAAAKFVGGFATAVSYKQFDLSAVFGYSIGGNIYNFSRQVYDSDGTYTDRNQMRLMNGWSRWEKAGDEATHPIAKYNNTDKGNFASSRFLENGDFLRMRSLTLGYNINLERYHVKNLRLFLSGENLFTITKYSGVDPEVAIIDDDGSKFSEDGGKVLSTVTTDVYPAVRKIMFGLNVTF